MKIQEWDIDRVRPYESNPRDNSESVAAVAASIKEFGWNQPIVVDRDGVIVCGHTRLLAAQRLGLKKVPVYVASDLTPEQVRAYRLADNKTAELATWNKERLAEELQAIAGSSFKLDLGLLGFSQVDLERYLNPAGLSGLVDPDHVPEAPAKAITKRGDVWILGDHRLMCGDSSSTDDLDRLLDGSPIHLVHTDPPYNVAVEPRSNNAIAAGLSSFPATETAASGKSKRQTERDVVMYPGKAKATHGQLRAKDRPIQNDLMSEEAFSEMLGKWFGNIGRVLLPGRAFYAWGGFFNIEVYPAALRKAGLYFSQTIIWIKEHPVITRKDWMGNHEWCYYGWKEGAGHEFFGEQNIPDTWELSRAKLGALAIGRGVQIKAGDGARIEITPPAVGSRSRQVDLLGDSITLYGASEVSDVWRVKKVNPQAMVHLTEKPVELAFRAIRCSSRPGENVLDLFGGSGSTLIAAQQTGRHAFLMELDPLYCDVIVRRFEQFTGLKAKRIGNSPATKKKPPRKRAAAATVK